MFATLPGYWLPALPTHQLGHRPRQVRIAGENIVIFRDHQGQVGALIDRCPHRGVALSLGKVTKDGCLQCPFHGWHFERNGSCRHVPFNPQVKKENLSAIAIPVEEKAGLIWVYTAPSSASNDLPPPLEIPYEGAELVGHPLVKIWRCHWTRAMENMLDVPHLPVVHRTSIGRGMTNPSPSNNPDMQLTLDKKSHGFLLRWQAGERASRGWLAWWKPAGMVLGILDKPWIYHNVVFCVPVDESTTRMVVFSVTTAPRFTRPALRLLGLFNRVVLGQDESVVTSSSPPEVPVRPSEASVPTDRPTLHFRAWYARQKQAWKHDCILSNSHAEILNRNVMREGLEESL